MIFVLKAHRAVVGRRSREQFFRFQSKRILPHIHDNANLLCIVDSLSPHKVKSCISPLWRMSQERGTYTCSHKTVRGNVSYKSTSVPNSSRGTNLKSPHEGRLYTRHRVWQRRSASWDKSSACEPVGHVDQPGEIWRLMSPSFQLISHLHAKSFHDIDFSLTAWQQISDLYCSINYKRIWLKVVKM